MKIIYITRGESPYVSSIAARLEKDGFKTVVNRGETDILDTEALIARLCELNAGGELCGILHDAPESGRTSIEGFTDEEWEKASRDGAEAAMSVMRAAGRLFMGAGHGEVVMLGSVYADKPSGFDFGFSASQSATQMLVREAAIDFGECGVGVYYVKRPLGECDLKNKNKLSNLYSNLAARYPDGKIPEYCCLDELMSLIFSGKAFALTGSTIDAEEALTLYFGRRNREE